MTKTPAIYAKNLNLTFKDKRNFVHALKDIDLVVQKGEFVSFIGPSGCGKTSLLRSIANLVDITSGTLLVNGISANEARLKRQYGYVFQSASLYPWRTILGNVTLPLKLMGFSKSEQVERAKNALILVGLGDVISKYPWQLSGGMQQRVGIARAMAYDADILLMDEPFGSLDEITRDSQNMQLLDLWQKTQKTILFVTHSIPEAVYLSTKIVVLSQTPGQIVEVIENKLPAKRGENIQETIPFLKMTARVRKCLRDGYEAV